MRQFNQNNNKEVKKVVTEKTNVSLRSIDNVARELIIGDTRVVLVNVNYVTDMEKRLKTLENEIDTLRTSKNSLMQMVQKIIQKINR
jgi:chaperonin cofactor prefoldin